MPKPSEVVETVLGSFRAAIGAEKFPIVVQQVASLVGGIKFENTDGLVKVSAKGIVTQGTKTKGMLPMNNPAAILYRFGCNIHEVTHAGNFLVNAGLPEKCEDWIKELKMPAKLDEKAVKA